MVNSDLKWDDHVTAITSKAGKRLWFMKQLRRAGVCQDDLLYYYQAVVKMFSVMLFRSFLATYRTTKHVHRRKLVKISGGLEARGS